MNLSAFNCHLLGGPTSAAWYPALAADAHASPYQRRWDAIGIGTDRTNAVSQGQFLPLHLRNKTPLNGRRGAAWIRPPSDGAAPPASGPDG